MSPLAPNGNEQVTQCIAEANLFHGRHYGHEMNGVPRNRQLTANSEIFLREAVYNAKNEQLPSIADRTNTTIDFRTGNHVQEDETCG